MYKRFFPNEYVKNIFQITPQLLQQKGIKGIITDLDNTLVEWDRPFATEQVIEWLASMKEAGIAVTIVSNNKEARVKAFCDPLQIPFIYRAKKPFKTAFHRALAQKGLQKDEVVVIGDQLLTDIFGGNRSGFYTILVVPVAKSDGLATKLNRLLERRIMNHFKRTGKIKWEE